MAGKRLTVVIAQAQGRNPAKLQLEEDLAAALILSGEVDCSVVPHLYDMSRDHSGLLFLRSVPGDLVVLNWLYPRAARWILDRQGVKGREGISELDPDEPDDEEGENHPAKESRAIGAVDVPKRTLWCIDLRTSADPQVYVDEIRRLARQAAAPPLVELGDFISSSPQKEKLERYLYPLDLVRAAKNGNGVGDDGASTAPPPDAQAAPDAVGRGGTTPYFVPEPTGRRWYPVIDYSRCTNCMECIDFCLFGVYGIDGAERILVEQQDNCKKGCPACSRVCPENAIIFPGHKTPAIAGADGEIGGLKIDLSKLFGAPNALDLAVAERDAELVADGRTAVGKSVGIPKRQADKCGAPRDALDDLMDGLDALDG